MWGRLQRTALFVEQEVAEGVAAPTYVLTYVARRANVARVSGQRDSAKVDVVAARRAIVCQLFASAVQILGE
jgi:hypothetical protein